MLLRDASALVGTGALGPTARSMTVEESASCRVGDRRRRPVRLDRGGGRIVRVDGLGGQAGFAGLGRWNRGGRVDVTGRLCDELVPSSERAPASMWCSLARSSIEGASVDSAVGVAGSDSARCRGRRRPPSCEGGVPRRAAGVDPLRSVLTPVRFRGRRRPRVRRSRRGRSCRQPDDA